MQSEIVAQGVELMQYGMGTVVVFLTLLVIATTLMSRGVNHFFPEPAASADKSSADAPGDGQAAHDPQLVAVISAAVHQHRNDQHRKS